MIATMGRLLVMHLVVIISGSTARGLSLSAMGSRGPIPHDKEDEDLVLIPRWEGGWERR